jgi:PAS domain S-box-containing protein
MKRYQETLLVSSIGLLVILVILLLSAKFIVLKSFRMIETADVTEHLERIVSTVDNDLASLGAWAGDYATWDDTYRYLQDSNPDFVSTNLTATSLAKLNIDLVALVRSTGEIVYATALNSKTAQIEPAPADLVQHLTPTSPLLQLPAAESTVKGILPLAGGPLLVVAKPVLTSAGTGPIKGALIMGRFINTAEIAHLANLTRIPLEKVPLDAHTLTAPPFSKAKPLSLANPIRVKRLNEETVHGFALFGDLYQRPALLIKATIPRHIYIQGVKTIRYFLVWCGLIALGGIIAINWGLKKYAQSQLYEEKERLFAAALTQTATAIVILEAASGRIVQANAAFSLLLGFAPSQLEGTLIRELLRDSQAEFEQCREATLRQGNRLTCALQLVHHDTSTVSVAMDANVIRQNGQQYLCLELHKEPIVIS